jgi:Sigma-70, region 4
MRCSRPAFDHRGKHVEPVPDWSASVDDPARQTELRAALSAAIEELPPDYRAVVVLRDVEGLAHCEIGDALGLTVGNVKTRVHRARLFLRQRLEASFAVASRGAVARELRCRDGRSMGMGCRSAARSSWFTAAGFRRPQTSRTARSFASFSRSRSDGGVVTVPPAGEG